MKNAASFRCLVLEDERDFAELIARAVESVEGEVTVANSVAEAARLVAGRGFDLVILDNRLPDGTGYEFYPEVRRRLPDAVMLMITGVPELGQAVKLTRNGLFDYLTKPVEVQVLLSCLNRAKLRMSVPREAVGEVVLGGESPLMQQALQKLEQASRHPEAAVLLLGETGTGKELAARLLHQQTYGQSNPMASFVSLNCSAVPSEMFEAELFGSEKGSYTGADRRRPGLVEAARGGTLFLDEVGDVPLMQQAKLLRFLESGEYRALGSLELKRFKGRIVSATNRNLEQDAREGRFRKDLLYRLDVVRVVLPPLRDRAEEIPVLVERLLGQLAAKYGRSKPLVRPEDLDNLRAYPFPGNVRELKNILERSLLHTPEGQAWVTMDQSWLPSGVESPTPPPLAMARELTPLELQEYHLIKKVLREEKGAIRRSAARLGVSHQVVLRRLRWWPELRQIVDEGRQES